MKNGTFRKIKRYKMMYLFLLPAVVTVILFNYKPMVGIVMAFQDFDLNYSYLSSPFVGLKHFREFLQDPDFYRGLRNTLALGSLSLLFGFPIPIVFALILNEIRSNKLKRVSQTISYLPHFISWVVTSTIILRLLDQNNGIVNNVLSMLGHERIGFMRESDFFWAITVIANIWKETGWSSIIYLSALAGVDQEMYEAAMVDGAGRFKRLIYITLPSIAPTIGLLFVLNVGSLITSGGLFDAVYNLQNAMVAEKAQTLEVFAYLEGIAYMRYSYATAITLTQSVIAFLMVVIANKIYKKLTGDGVF